MELQTRKGIFLGILAPRFRLDICGCETIFHTFSNQCIPIPMCLQRGKLHQVHLKLQSYIGVVTVEEKALLRSCSINKTAKNNWKRRNIYRAA